MENTEKTIEQRGLKNTKFLATFFGRSERHIQQLATEKVIKSIRIKGVNYYELIPSIQSYIRYLQEIVDRRKKTSEEQESEKLEADIRYKKAKADRAELDLKIFKADLLVADDVQAYSEDLAATIKSLLTALPGRLAMDVMNVGSASEASALIEDAVNEVLEELAGYEFNIDFYKQRVAERQGRSVDNDDTEDS